MQKCLIVDDSRVVRKVVRKILEELGFECDEVEDGKQAYDFCMKTMPDIIFLDWNMPVMTGIEFLRKLRAEPTGGTSKVILCTTENDFSFIQEALAAGANEYIMKPFDSDIVESKLKQLGIL